MEALGSIFANIFEFFIFDYFYMFYKSLNVGHIRIFRILGQNPKNPDIADVQRSIKHVKISRKLKIQKYLQNWS